MPVKKVSSQELELGMFVCSLDRPWSETPFLFQGFMIREESELEKLRELTRYVYIMVPDEEIKLRGLPSGPTSTTNHSNVVGQATYETTTTILEELPEIHNAHQELTQLITEVSDVVQAQREIDREKVAQSVAIMVHSIERNPDAYVWLTRIRRFDSYIYKDALAASAWATALGRQLGMTRENLQLLATGMLLMDVGKMSLPKELLHKPSRLEFEEWELIKTHVEKGLQLLESKGNYPPEILDIVRGHHERLDGSGYPQGLTGSQIPLFAQIAGLIDFYVSVTNPRPFAPSLSPAKALHMLYQQQGTYFDETLVQRFIQVIGTYPTGSLVELSSGEVGVVMSQNIGFRLRPNVVLLLDPNKQPYGSNTILNLLDQTKDRNGKPLNIVNSLPDGAYGLVIDKLPW